MLGPSGGLLDLSQCAPNPVERGDEPLTDFRLLSVRTSLDVAVLDPVGDLRHCRGEGSLLDDDPESVVRADALDDLRSGESATTALQELQVFFATCPDHESSGIRLAGLQVLCKDDAQGTYLGMDESYRQYDYRYTKDLIFEPWS